MWWGGEVLTRRSGQWRLIRSLTNIKYVQLAGLAPYRRMIWSCVNFTNDSYCSAMKRDKSDQDINPQLVQFKPKTSQGLDCNFRGKNIQIAQQIYRMKMRQSYLHAFTYIQDFITNFPFCNFSIVKFLSTWTFQKKIVESITIDKIMMHGSVLINTVI